MARPLMALLLAMSVVAGCRTALGARSASDTAWTVQAVDSLSNLGTEDQAGRTSLMAAMQAQDTATIFAVMRGDSLRSRWLRSQVEVRSWPTPRVAGAGASNAAWLILQHSPFTDWQLQMLPVLEGLAAAGDLPRADLALFEDKVMVAHGRPQRYATQFNVVDGRLVPAPVADVAAVDSLRSWAELPAMERYVRLLGDAYGLPVKWPP